MKYLVKSSEEQSIWKDVTLKTGPGNTGWIGRRYTITDKTLVFKSGENIRSIYIYRFEIKPKFIDRNLGTGICEINCMIDGENDISFSLYIENGDLRIEKAFINDLVLIPMDKYYFSNVPIYGKLKELDTAAVIRSDDSGLSYNRDSCNIRLQYPSGTSGIEIYLTNETSYITPGSAILGTDYDFRRMKRLVFYDAADGLTINETIPLNGIVFDFTQANSTILKETLEALINSMDIYAGALTTTAADAYPELANIILLQRSDIDRFKNIQLETTHNYSWIDNKLYVW